MLCLPTVMLSACPSPSLSLVQRTLPLPLAGGGVALRVRGWHGWGAPCIRIARDGADGRRTPGGRQANAASPERAFDSFIAAARCVHCPVGVVAGCGEAWYRGDPLAGADFSRCRAAVEVLGALGALGALRLGRPAGKRPSPPPPRSLAELIQFRRRSYSPAERGRVEPAPFGQPR